MTPPKLPTEPPSKAPPKLWPSRATRRKIIRIVRSSVDESRPLDRAIEGAIQGVEARLEGIDRNLKDLVEGQVVKYRDRNTLSMLWAIVFLLAYIQLRGPGFSTLQGWLSWIPGLKPLPKPGTQPSQGPALPGNIKLVYPIQGQSQNPNPDPVLLPGAPRTGKNGGTRPHGGIDQGAPIGTPILAPITGRIVETSPDTWVGGCLGIESEDKTIRIRLVHISRNWVRRWKVGDKVTVGQQVAVIEWHPRGKEPGRLDVYWGSGPHLHLETYVNGQNLMGQSVSFWLKAHSIPLKAPSIP